MDKRSLPSRQAKNRAQDLFREMAGRHVSSSDSDGYSSNGEEKGSDSDIDNDYVNECSQPRPQRRSKRPRRTTLKPKLPNAIQYVVLDDHVHVKVEPESDETSHQEDTSFNETNSTSDCRVFPKSFSLLQQGLKSSDTAIWTTNLFTITAVLSDGKETKIESKETELELEKSEPTKEGSKSGTIPCPLCNINFTKMKLKKHINAVHPGVEKPFICDICNKGWRSWDRMNDHRISHSDTATHQCDLCDKSFKRKYTLQAHVFYKHGTTDPGSRRSTSQAKVGDQKSPEPIGRNVGPYKIDQNALPPFKCPEPNCKEFHDTICRLQRHYAQAHRERSWICELCGKSFPGQRELIVHGRCHKEGRPFVCEKCGSTYKSKAHLNCHILRSHDEQGHEAYKAYRRMTVKKLRVTKLKTQINCISSS